MSEWLNSNLPQKSSVGIDPYIVSSSQYKSFEDQLNSGGHQLISVERNLVDDVWLDRPEPVQNAIVPMNIKYSGKDTMLIGEFTNSLNYF